MQQIIIIIYKKVKMSSNHLKKISLIFYILFIKNILTITLFIKEHKDDFDNKWNQYSQKIGFVENNSKYLGYSGGP